MQYMKITKANEDYLEAIYLYEIAHNFEPMKSTLLAAEFNVSKAMVTKATNELREKGFISKSDYSKISLTELGKEVAKKTLHKHEVIFRFLMSIGVNEETASIECCLIEHIISDDTIQKMEQQLEKKDK